MDTEVLKNKKDISEKVKRESEIKKLVRKIPEGFYEKTATIIFVMYFLTLIADGVLFAIKSFDRTKYESLNAFYMVGMVAVIFAIFYVFSKCILNGFENVLSRCIKEKKWEICFVFLLVWVTASTFKSSWVEKSLNGNQGIGGGLKMYVVMAAFYICAKSIKRKKSLKIIMWSVMALSFLEVYHIFLQSYEGVKNLCGTVINSNHVAYFLGLAIMVNVGLLIQEKNKILYIFLWFLLGGNMAALVLNNTFGVYLAVTTGFVFWVVINLWCRRKQNLELILSIIMFVLISCVVNHYTKIVDNNFMVFNHDIENLSDNTNDAVIYAGSGRMGIWTKCIDVVKEKPIWGCGTDISAFWATNVPHNEFLQLAAENGIPAFLMYVTGLVLLFMNKIKKRKELTTEEIILGSACFTYLFSSFFGVIVYYSFPIYWIFMGILGANNRLK